MAVNVNVLLCNSVINEDTLDIQHKTGLVKRTNYFI